MITITCTNADERRYMTQLLTLSTKIRLHPEVDQNEPMFSQLDLKVIDESAGTEENYVMKTVTKVPMHYELKKVQ